MKTSVNSLPVSIDTLQSYFNNKIHENVRMANYSTCRVGGLVNGLLVINSEKELVHATQTLWGLNVPFKVIGSGSNILVSDKGFTGLILLNRAHNIKIRSNEKEPCVFAESGAILGTLARQTALRGFTGLEWATSVPGTVGGAVYGNAGAHGADIKSNLKMATILHPKSGIQTWSVDDMDYAYRSSKLKRERLETVILSAEFNLEISNRDACWEKIKLFSERRQTTQPPGASSGSTFKNPPGDYAGRLLEQVGMKGIRIGQAQFSPIHANFIVNEGNASADDYFQLIKLGKQKVLENFNIELELEIELIGDFNNEK